MYERLGRGAAWGLLIGVSVMFLKSVIVPVPAGVVSFDRETGSVDADLILVENLKAECEEVHQTECEISVFYLPKANKTNDGR